jgi:hypothetical protein
MKTGVALPTAVLAGLVILAPLPASADNYFEVEHARANARAGGPISERDAELLDRYGALSGTGDWRARAPAGYRKKPAAASVQKLPRKMRRSDD